MTLKRKLSSVEKQEENSEACGVNERAQTRSRSPRESKDTTSPSPTESKIVPTSESSNPPKTQVSPSCLGSKTTLLSARSQIEILNPNEPQENGTFDSKKSPLALLAATCNNIGKDCGPNSGSNPTAGFPFFATSNHSARNLSCGSPVNEMKLSSPLQNNNRMRLPSEPEQLSNPLGNIGLPPSSIPSSMSKAPTNTTPPSLLKYMDKLSPIAMGNDYAQLQAKFVSALAGNTGHQNTTSNLADMYDPLKLAAAIQQAKNAAAAAYMFPSAASTNPLSALANLTSGSVGSGLHTSSNSTLSGLSSISNSSSGCQMCPTNQFIAGGGHSPSKPGAGSPYITFVPVKTAGNGTALVPVCADRGCLNCITAIRQAQLSPNGSNSSCNHCTSDQQSKNLAASFTSSANPAIPGSGSFGLGLPTSNTSSLLSNSFLNSLNIQAALQTSPSLAALYQQLAAAHSSASSGNLPPSSVSDSTSPGNAQLDSSRIQTSFSPKSANQEVHKCKWAPAGGGQPCGKGFNSADDLMNHIKHVHMSTNGTVNLSNSVANQQNENCPTSISSAFEEASALQQLVNNRRLSPHVMASQNATMTTTNSLLGSLSSLSAANSLSASLSSSLSRKIPGSLDLASALSAAARYHPYSKFPLPTLPATGVQSLTSSTLAAPLSGTQSAPNFSGLTPAGLNALLSSAAASSFLMYDLPKA